eukprot:52324_1
MIRESMIWKNKQSDYDYEYGSVNNKKDDTRKYDLEKQTSKGELIDSHDTTCSICLCEYEHGDKCFRLPCSHIYHEECLSLWTANHVTCPLCNLNIESEE